MEDQPKPTRTEQRGRKRNDALPPSRAREVQRAFRARRAAHLAALEERVKEVETENAELRIALNMPPANRPAIRSGPTGRGKVIDTPGSSNAKMDDFSGSESGSDEGTPDGGSKASGSRKRNASSSRLSRPASGQDNHSNFNSPVPDMFRNSGLGSMPYGYNMFPGAFPGGTFPGGQRPFSPSMMSGAFPGASVTRPEDLLQFQQQLNQHQHQLAQSFGSNGTSLPNPGGMFPGSPSSLPFTAQYQHLAQQQAAYQALLQQQQQQLQQQQPARPHSSNSQHSNDGHPTFPLQNHHRQPTSQHSSPLASGSFNGFPNNQQGGQNSTGSINGSVFHPPSRSGTPNLQQQATNRSASAGTPSGRIEIGSVQAYSIMDRLKACCKLDDQAVSSDPGLLAFCNDIVTALGAQPSDCVQPPSPPPPTPSPTASPASHPSTPNPSSVLSAAQLKSTYLTIFNVWTVVRQSYPLPFEAAVRDAMEAGSKAAKALLKAASASTVKVEGWKGSKGAYGEKIVCRNTNGVEVERAFLDAYMVTLQEAEARKSAANGLSMGGSASGGGGGAVLGSWGADDNKLENGVVSADDGDSAV